LKEVQDNNLGRRHEIEVAFPPAVLHVARLVSPLRYWNWLECPPDEAIDVPGVGNVGVWSIGAHALTVTGSVEDSSNINQSKKCSKAGVPLPKPTWKSLQQLPNLNKLNPKGYEWKDGMAGMPCGSVHFPYGVTTPDAPHADMAKARWTFRPENGPSTSEVVPLSFRLRHYCKVRPDLRIRSMPIVHNQKPFSLELSDLGKVSEVPVSLANLPDPRATIKPIEPGEPQTHFANVYGLFGGTTVRALPVLVESGGPHLRHLEPIICVSPPRFHR
jgi:hypothetical protein